MQTRLLVAEAVFWLHVLIVAFWYSLFFVPLSMWPWGDKITFHFWLTIGIVFHQFAWGALLMPWTKKYRMVCALTTFMQLLRGKDIADPKNYDHSFTQELVGRTGATIPHRLTTIITLSILTVVSIQFFFR